MMEMTLFLVAGTLTSLAASAQGDPCCFGAQSESAVSKNKRFRVEAIPLEPHSHGPYRYRYTWFERGLEGSYRDSSSFEVRYDSTNHFQMSLFVSPTGNGFLVWTTISRPSMIFYSRSGERLYSVEAVDPTVSLYPESTASEDGATLRVFERGSGVIGRRERDRRLFLPMGDEAAGVAELLRPPEAADPKPFFSSLDHDDPDVRERAVLAIEALGVPAIEALTLELGRTRSSEASARMEEILANIRQKTKDHAHPHRHLLLLSCALSHPDPAIASVARERLRALLPREATLEAAWIEAHLEALHWDEDRRCYR